MHPQPEPNFLQRFLAPKDLPLPTHPTMPAACPPAPATHDFLVLIQLPDFAPDCDGAIEYEAHG